MRKRKNILLLCILFVLAMAILPACGTNSSGGSGGAGKTEQAGTYTGKSEGQGEITANVTVDDEGKITDLQIEAPMETPGLGADAAEKLKNDILEHQTVKVDIVSGATITSKAVIAAVSPHWNKPAIGTNGRNGQNGEDEEVTVDVVVVGGGTAGTAAALAASEAGAKFWH